MRRYVVYCELRLCVRFLPGTIQKEPKFCSATLNIVCLNDGSKNLMK